MASTLLYVVEVIRPVSPISSVYLNFLRQLSKMATRIHFILALACIATAAAEQATISGKARSLNQADGPGIINKPLSSTPADLVNDPSGRAHLLVSRARTKYCLPLFVSQPSAHNVLVRHLRLVYIPLSASTSCTYGISHSIPVMR